MQSQTQNLLLLLLILLLLLLLLGDSGNVIVFKVPRQCPTVILVNVRWKGLKTLRGEEDSMMGSG